MKQQNLHRKRKYSKQSCQSRYIWA
jgi:hypothetical protein